MPIFASTVNTSCACGKRNAIKVQTVADIALPAVAGFYEVLLDTAMSGSPEWALYYAKGGETKVDDLNYIITQKRNEL